MRLISASSRTTTANRFVLWSFFVLLAIAAALATQVPRNSSAVPALFVAMLAIGWIVAATLLAHLCNGKGLVLEPPELNGAFHALLPFRIGLRLANRRHYLPILFFTVIFDASLDSRPLPSPPKFLGDLPPGSTAEFEWQIIVRRRGTLQIVGARVSNSFPGAIVKYEHHFSFVGEALILPTTYLLKAQAGNLLIGRRQATGRLHASPAALEEFIGAREYRPGDNPRTVDLRLSLRAPGYPDQLIVREFEDPSEDDICIILDTVVSPDDEDKLRLFYRHEVSISFAISMCRFLLDRKKRVRFRTASGDGRKYDRRLQKTSQLPHLEAWLATVVPTEDGDQVLRSLEEANRMNAAVLFISLRDIIVERKHRRLSILTVPPDWQRALVQRVLTHEAA